MEHLFQIQVQYTNTVSESQDKLTEKDSKESYAEQKGVFVSYEKGRRHKIPQTVSRGRIDKDHGKGSL